MSLAIFVSSTYRDLAEHRARVHDTLETAGFRPVEMKNFGAQPEDSRQASLNEVAASDIFVAIYAYRYGHVPDQSSLSITEMELDHAERLHKPVLCFIVAEGHHWQQDCSETSDKSEELARLRNRVEKRYTVGRFTTPDNLANVVLASLFRYLRSAKLATDYELIAPSSFGSQPPDVRRPIPTVLVQVVDRSPQVHILRRTLERSGEATDRRSKPFVFLVLGTTEDAQEGLVQLYREEILPAFIRSAIVAQRNLYVPIPWPPSGNAIGNLKRDLAAAVLLPPGASDDAIRQRLGSGMGAHTLAYYINSTDWTTSDSELLLDWIRYWNSLSLATTAPIVTLFVCLQHPLSRWRLYERLRLERFYRRVQQTFEGDSTVACLPRLSQINRDHVLQWANTAVPSRSRRFNSTLLKLEATRPFGFLTRQLPLDTLAPTLHNALQVSQIGNAAGPPPWIQ